MTDHDEQHSPFPIIEVRGPRDGAGEALGDAMRMSFRILKWIMVIVVVLYCLSGVTYLDQSEKALVLNYLPLPGISSIEERGPGGIIWSYPRPMAEIIRIPVAQRRTLKIETQDLNVEDRAKARLSGGLDPAQHGSMMSGFTP